MCWTMNPLQSQSICSQATPRQTVITKFRILIILVAFERSTSIRSCKATCSCSSATGLRPKLHGPAHGKPQTRPRGGRGTPRRAEVIQSGLGQRRQAARAPCPAPGSSIMKVARLGTKRQLSHSSNFSKGHSQQAATKEAGLYKVSFCNVSYRWNDELEM